MKKKMIGLSTSYYALKGLSISDSVKRITELGFDTIELGAAHVYEENIWDKLKMIRKQFPDIMFLLHTLFPPMEEKIWFNPAGGLNEQNILVINNLFKAAKILGSSQISIHPPVLNSVSINAGKLPNGFLNLGLGQSMDLLTAKENFLRLMEYLDALAKKDNIVVGIENLDSTFFDVVFSTKNDFAGIFECFNNTGMLLDVGHAIQTRNLDELVSLNGHIKELHLHNVEEMQGGEKHGHYAIRDPSYFDPIKKIIVNKSIPLIFEHGLHVTEKEIVEEKQLLQNFIIRHLEGKISI